MILTDEDRRDCAAGRAAQGLPPTITDPTTLEKVAAIVRHSGKPPADRDEVA